MFNPRGIWKAINELKSRKQNDLTISQLELDNIPITEAVDISNALNKRFVEIGPRLASTISSTSKHFTDYVISSSAVFSFGTISNKTVHDFLCKLPINKSTGLDNLSCRLLRDAAPIISQSLCDLFNKSLVLGVFPSDWKVAKVFPLHKGQSKSDPNNYRPISILSSVSKIFEKLFSLNFMIISMKMTFCPRLNQAFDPFTRQPRLCFMPLMSGSITSIKAC